MSSLPLPSGARDPQQALVDYARRNGGPEASHSFGAKLFHHARTVGVGDVDAKVNVNVM